jgi:hypothetical protein
MAGETKMEKKGQNQEVPEYLNRRRGLGESGKGWKRRPGGLDGTKRNQV